MIRSGDERDIPAIESMSREFWKQTIYNDDEYCSATVTLMIRMCIDTSMLSVLEIDGEVVGFACGVIGGLLANASVKTGTELAWWVDEKHRRGRNGIALLKHIEGLAKKAGIKYWNMVYMESSMPESIKAIYEKMGYQRSEVVYTRVL